MSFVFNGNTLVYGRKTLLFLFTCSPRDHSKHNVIQYFYVIIVVRGIIGIPGTTNESQPSTSDCTAFNWQMTFEGGNHIRTESCVGNLFSAVLWSMGGGVSRPLNLLVSEH